MQFSNTNCDFMQIVSINCVTNIQMSTHPCTITTFGSFCWHISTGSSSSHYSLVKHTLNNLQALPRSTYMRFHRMHEITITAMEAITPMTADKMTTTSTATTVPCGICSQLPHTGRQNEPFLTTLQEKSLLHWIVLQLSNLAVGGGWRRVSSCLPLPLPLPLPIQVRNTKF